MRRAHAHLVLSLSLGLSAAARAEAPAVGVPLAAGDVVQFDLSTLPRSYEGAGKVTCTGTVIKATGPEEEACERPYRFEVPPDAARIVYVFRAKAGGSERTIELPLTRGARPVTFTAPAQGTLQGPKPVTLPAEVADGAARRAAEEQCGACRGGEFAFKSHEITEPPKPVGGAPRIQLRITTTVQPRPQGAKWGGQGSPGE